MGFLIKGIRYRWVSIFQLGTGEGKENPSYKRPKRGVESGDERKTIMRTSMRIRVTIERIDDNDKAVRSVMSVIEEEDSDDPEVLDSKGLGLAVGEALGMFSYPRLDEAIANAVDVCGLDDVRAVNSDATRALIESASQIVCDWDLYDDGLDKQIAKMKPSDN